MFIVYLLWTSIKHNNRSKLSCLFIVCFSDLQKQHVLQSMGAWKWKDFQNWEDLDLMQTSFRPQFVGLSYIHVAAGWRCPFHFDNRLLSKGVWRCCRNIRGQRLLLPVLNANSPKNLPHWHENTEYFSSCARLSKCHQCQWAIGTSS